MRFSSNIWLEFGILLVLDVASWIGWDAGDNDINVALVMIINVDIGYNVSLIMIR